MISYMNALLIQSRGAPSPQPCSACTYTNLPRSFPSPLLLVDPDRSYDEWKANIVR